MKTKRIISFLISILILFSTSVSFAQGEYATRGEVVAMLLEAADFYNTGVSKNDIIKGYEDGLLHEERPVTRAEALVMLKRAFKNVPVPVGHNARIALSAESFTDIPAWAENELSEIFSAGLVAGTSPNIFSPQLNVTKEQMELFIERMYSLQGANIKDDFYASVNKETLEKMDLLTGNPVNGTIESLSFESNGNVDKIIKEIVNQNHPEGSVKQKIADFYKCAVDVKNRNKTGIKPIEKYLKKIDSAKNIGELTVLHSLLAEELCLPAFLEFQLTYDLEDGKDYLLYLSVMTPLAPKGTYTDGKNKEEYIKYISTLFSLLGDDELSAQKNAHTYFEFEKALAKNMLEIRESSNIQSVYNVLSYNKICSLFPDFNMEKLINSCGFESEEKIVVSDTKLLETFSHMYSQSNLEALKLAMKIRLAVKIGETLNEDFLRASIEFDNAITGIDSEYVIEDYILNVLDTAMPDYLSEVYSAKYFDEESKRDVERMTREITQVFKKRIDALEFLNEKTKEKAKKKLDSMKVKIGYPDSFDSYLDGITIISPKQGGTYFDNMIKINKARRAYYGKMQKAEPDREMWLLTPYTVNAIYNSAMNDITLPAAVLQKPLYDKNAPYEKNLGGIGFIIAHEITHAFDSNGSLFDENGNMHDWWSEDDRAEFSKLCAKVSRLYDGCEAVPGIQNDGTLTLNENIADLGAVACITQLANEKNLDHKLMYKSFAAVWAGTATREFYDYLSLNDVHSSGKIRVNRTLMNFPEFYEAFQIKSGDGMYLPPEDRVIIW